MAEDQRARGPRGRYTSTLKGAERDAEAARLYMEVRNYQTVADMLGFSDRGGAWRAVQRCKEVVKRQAGEELIAVEAAELDELYTRALEVLERDHITVSQGRVVNDDNGVPVLDDGPKLAAIREMRNIRESYRKLFGLDAPHKVTMTMEAIDAALAETEAAIAAEVAAADDETAEAAGPEAGEI